MSALARTPLALVCLAVTAIASERPPAHPSDEAEVFTGGEDVEQGHARHPPAVAYWRIHVALRLKRARAIIGKSSRLDEVLSCSSRMHAPI